MGKEDGLAQCLLSQEACIECCSLYQGQMQTAIGMRTDKISGELTFKQAAIKVSVRETWMFGHLLDWIAPSHLIGSFQWLEGSHSNIPSDAVKGGEDADKGVIYVGRALHNDDVLPAKVCPNHGCAYICYNGEEIAKTEYQVLTSQHIAWKPTQGDNIPSQAIPVGRTSSGESLYSGRTIVDGHMTPGKVHPSHKCLYVPYAGEELSHSEYEILILM